MLDIDIPVVCYYLQVLIHIWWPFWITLIIVWYHCAYMRMVFFSSCVDFLSFFWLLILNNVVTFNKVAELTYSLSYQLFNSQTFEWLKLILTFIQDYTLITSWFDVFLLLKWNTTDRTRHLSCGLYIITCKDARYLWFFFSPLLFPIFFSLSSKEGKSRTIAILWEILLVYTTTLQSQKMSLITEQR